MAMSMSTLPMISNPNFLYRNDGKGKFTEIGTWSGAGLNSQGIAQAGMGVDAADIDGDGLQDIVLSTFIHDSSSLYRNLGSLQFEDISSRLSLKKITYEVLKWGCASSSITISTATWTS